MSHNTAQTIQGIFITLTVCFMFSQLTSCVKHENTISLEKIKAKCSENKLNKE